eukprot:403341825
MNSNINPNPNLELSLLENEIEKISSRYQLSNSQQQFSFTQTLQQNGSLSNRGGPMSQQLNYQDGNQTNQQEMMQQQMLQSQMYNQQTLPLQMPQQSMIQTYNLNQGNLQAPTLKLNENNYQDGLINAIKSPSVLTFGGTMINSNSNGVSNSAYSQSTTTRQSQNVIPDLINPLQEQTLNNQGQIPKPKDQKQNSQQVTINPSKINPKDLSNEELEYIIKTGKIPPRLIQAQNKVVAIDLASLNKKLVDNESPAHPKFQSVNRTYKFFPKPFRQFSNFKDSRFIPELSSNQSQAASQAMKALSDKVKQLESENQLLNDKLSITETQYSDQVHRLQQKLREEIEKSQRTELQMKEELQMLKRQVENVENEKLRHLEENSSEREQWRTQLKQVEEENSGLKRQLEENLEKYAGIEETIRDIRRREQHLRERYEREVDSEKERGMLIEKDVEDTKRRYEDLKSKLKEKNKNLEVENQQLNEELDKLKSEKERQINHLQRDLERWKRECQMLKEEMSILGGSGDQEQQKFVGGKECKKEKKTKLVSSGITPKSSQYVQNRRCKSPLKQRNLEDPNNILIRTMNVNQTIDDQIFKSIESNTNTDQSQPSGQATKRSKAAKKTIEKNIRKISESVTKQTAKQSKIKNKKRHNSNNPNVSSHQQKIEMHQQRTSSALKNRVSSSERKSRSRSSHNHNMLQNHSSASKLTKSKLKNLNSQLDSQIRKNSRGKSPNLQKSKHKERSLNGVQSQSNLISINTKKGRAENVEILDNNSSIDTKLQESKDYIFIENNPSQRSQSNQRQQQQQLFEQNLQFRNQNQYKRPSIESIGSIPFGLSSTNSEYGAFLYSHQSSVDQNAGSNFLMPNIIDPTSSQVNLDRYSKPLDLNDFNSSVSNPQSMSGTLAFSQLNGSQSTKNAIQHERLSVDNQIFYLEREIFDFNQQYKTLLSQQSQALSSSNNNHSSSSGNLNIQLRQVAQLLEDKSERLFELKKQQQQMLLQNTYRSSVNTEFSAGKLQQNALAKSSSNVGLYNGNEYCNQASNPFIETGVRSYQIKEQQ